MKWSFSEKFEDIKVKLEGKGCGKKSGSCKLEFGDNMVISEMRKGKAVI